jgi:hypothetical protein
VPPKLGTTEKTARLEAKLTELVKGRAERMAARDAGGDLSAWLRGLINKEWNAMHNTPDDFDYTVRLKYGTFAVRDVAPRVSAKPRWEVAEIFENGIRSPLTLASIDIDKWGQHPPFSGSHAQILNDVFMHIEQRHGAGTMETRPLTRS